MANFYIPSTSNYSGASSDRSSSAPSGSRSNSNFYTPSTSAWRKRKEERDQAATEASLVANQTDEAAKKAAEDGKNFFEKTGDVAGAVGTFVKDAAVDVKDTAVGAFTGTKNVFEGSAATSDNLKRTEARVAISKESNQKLQDAMGSEYDNPKSKKWDSPEIKAIIDDGEKQISNFDKQNKDAIDNNNKNFKESQAVDTRKVAFQAAETFLTVATLGIGTPIKAGIKAGVKQGAKAVANQSAKKAFETAVKVGGADAVRQIIRQGGQAAIKKAAQETLEAGTKAVAKSTGQRLAAAAGKDSLIGAAYGVTLTGREADYSDGNAENDPALSDYLLNIAFGAGIGAVIPVAGAGIKKGFQATKGAVKGKPGVKVAKTAPKTQSSEVVQVVDKTTGEKTFYRIPSDQRDNVVSGIDNVRDGSATAGQVINGKVTHVTARSPEDMAKRGFKDGGVYNSGESDVNAMMNQGVDEQSTKYGINAMTRVKNWVGDQVNPYRALAKIDDAYAKATGKPRHMLEASNNLEDLARRSAVSERQAAAMFYKELDVPSINGGKDKVLTASDLIKKYKGDSPEGLEFNNYTNSKFDLEFRAKNKGNKRIQRNYTDEQLQSFVDNYESRNPAARQDLATKKSVNDMAVDYMADSGAISRAEANQIKSAYKNAVPLERIFPDDLARPEVTGKNVGSIAKQTVIQKLEGGSDIPLSNSFDTMLNRVYKAVSQGNRAKLAQKMLERSEMGLISGSKVSTTGANKEARNTLREQSQLISKGVRNLTNKTKVSNRQIRSIASELQKLNKQGLQVSLKKGGKNPLPGFTPEVLDKLVKTKGKSTTSRQFFKALVEADPADLEVIRKKIATRQPKLASKLDDVANIRREIDALKVVKTTIKEVTAEFGDDPTTGKQIISGLIDGEQYKMEVPPAIAKAIQGLDSKKLEGVLKVFAIIKKPFEVTWTGVFNPVFAVTSFLVYDTPMSIINSPRGRQVFSAKAVAESFKSINSGSKFQKALAKEGARPYGGSGASSFVKPDAKMIAAQRSILTQIGHLGKNPEVLVSRVDIFGGKLANATRTRVARSEYDSLLKIAKNNGEDIASEAVQKRAMEGAALAYRTIMPDYDTMSHLTRQLNSVIPFYAASLAGTRSFGQAIRRDPRNTLIKAGTVGLLPTIGVTAYNLMSPTGQDFYQDMQDSGNTRTLDDNLVVVLPGASKDDKTGEWSGVIKIPLAPEFRAINQTTWRSVTGMMGGKGPDASHVALSLFDTITGGVRTSQNPLLTTYGILAGQDPQTGEQLIKGNMANLPKEEQMYEWTSGAGKFVGGVLNTSPIQGDKILSQFGLVGQTAKNEGKPVEAVVENVINRVTGAYGESAANSFYKTYSPLKSKRTAISAEITSLIKQGKRNEARTKANEYNESLRGTFASFDEKYGTSEARDPGWNDLMNGLTIKTSDSGFNARAKQ